MAAINRIRGTAALTFALRTSELFADAFPTVGGGREAEADPDCTEPGVSIACQKAKIIAIHNIPGKVIKKNQKRMRAAAATPQKTR